MRLPGAALHVMRHSKQIISWALIALCFVWPLYDWFVVDDGPAYFASNWRRILLLAAISIGGGLAVLVFMKLPDITRGRLTTISFTVGGASATWCCGYFIWQFVRLRSFLVEVGEFWMLAFFALIGIGLLALVAFVWFSFWRYCQRIYGQRHAA